MNRAVRAWGRTRRLYFHARYLRHCRRSDNRRVGYRDILPYHAEPLALVNGNLSGIGFNPRGESTQIYNVENTDLSLIAPPTGPCTFTMTRTSLASLSP